MKRDIFGRAFREATSVERELMSLGIQPIEVPRRGGPEADHARVHGHRRAPRRKKEVIPVVQSCSGIVEGTVRRRSTKSCASSRRSSLRRTTSARSTSLRTTPSTTTWTPCGWWTEDRPSVIRSSARSMSPDEGKERGLLPPHRARGRAGLRHRAREHGLDDARTLRVELGERLVADGPLPPSTCRSVATSWSSLSRCRTRSCRWWSDSMRAARSQGARRRGVPLHHRGEGVVRGALVVAVASRGSSLLEQLLRLWDGYAQRLGSRRRQTLWHWSALDRVVRGLVTAGPAGTARSRGERQRA